MIKLAPAIRTASACHYAPGPTIVATDRLQHFFEQSHDTAPDAIALEADDHEYTYAELESRANQLAHHLHALGLKSGARIGLLLERSIHTYTSLLAVLKVGGVYVPIDPSSPAERVAFIVGDAGLAMLLTQGSLSANLGGLSCPILALDSPSSAGIAERPTHRIQLEHNDDGLCCILYTSGTTGRPKGVLIGHESMCHLVRVCTPTYGYQASDRVFQGMTLAFDFSVEEIWPTFAVGATLVAGPNDHRRFGGALAEFLIDKRISVFCCVPTLLATFNRDVESVRLLNIGGEACPPELVGRWARRGRRILNTYGPTEATVTAIWAELLPGKPVTIGRPMAGYTVHLLDEKLRPVASGEEGEICIGGPGVARGYLNRPELTADRFVPDPGSDRPAARLYRTGDLGRLNEDGEYEYLGRIDTQVKIRGYRIELSEIESLLLEIPGVGNAAVGIVNGVANVVELAAYVVPQAGFDIEELRRIIQVSLRKRLPPHMVPAYIETIDAIPTLPSHKTDRSRLPHPVRSRLAGDTDDVIIPPTTDLERQIAACWSRAFDQEVRCVEVDFFLDLGGHSLFAARVVSDLRELPGLSFLAIADLYAHPTVQSLAQHVEASRTSALPEPRPVEVHRKYSSRRVWIAGAMQFAFLYLTLIPWLAPTVAILLLLTSQSLSTPAIVLGIAAAAAAAPLIALLLPVVAKWLLLGRVRPGRHPLWGWFFCRWWLVRKLIQSAPIDYLVSTPLFRSYLRLLGARIGNGCHLGSARIDVPDLIEIGDGASINYDVELDPSRVADGWLHLDEIHIGTNAYVGTNSVIEGGAKIGDSAFVLEQSLVAGGQTIPDGETWAGSPSRSTVPDPNLVRLAAAGVTRRWPISIVAGYCFGLTLLMLAPSLFLLPGLIVIWGISEGDLWLGLAFAPAAGLLYVVLACAFVVVGKRLALPRVSAGNHALRSWFGLRKWFADRLMTMSLGLTNSLYSTLYLLPFLRLLGARVGPRAEVSTVSHIDPDLLTLGPECFIADLAAVGAARIINGQIVLGETEVGARGFVGNAALVPGDTKVPGDSLIGVLSVPPNHPMQPGSSWLGSPAIFLPQRQASAKFDESKTYRPSFRSVACRLMIEFLRIVLPATLSFCAFFLIALTALIAMDEISIVALFCLLPAIYLASGLLITLVVVFLKWLVVGRYRPRVEPQWSHFVWRTELITGLYENVAVPWMLHWFAGTAMMAPLLRLLGARIGRRVWMESNYLTEFDLVTVGDDAAVSGQAALQTHLFEDRVMKMSTVTLGPGCAVGTRAVVLYDAVIGADTEIEALSLAMKGECLNKGNWRGIPARMQ